MLRLPLNARPIQARIFCFLLIAVFRKIVFAIDPIRVNAGGDTIIDPQQRRWEADEVNKYYSTGNAFWACPKDISNTTNDSLYCTYRWFNQAAPYRYTFPKVPNGKYTVRLHFAELFYKAANKRVFHIYVESSLVASNYDIYRQAGSHNTATVLQQHINVTDSNGITIEMVRVKENPAIMGIEIIPYGIVTRAPTEAPTAAPIPMVEPGQSVARINAGGQSYVDSNGSLWSADKFVLNNYGQVYTTCPNAISNTIDDTLYCSQRWFSQWSGTPYVYSIPIASSGIYEARLHFAEIFFSAVGARVFDVYVEGILVRDNLDVYSVAGGLNVAHLVTVPVTVSDGAVTIELVAQIENPFISAIEVVRLPSNSTFITAPTPAPTPFQTILINCGGEAYLESSGVRTWIADKYFDDGFTFSNSAIGIAGTLDDPIYQSERWGEFVYDIPVPKGEYEIIIHLAEIYHQNPGTRVFDMTIEGKPFYGVDINEIASGRYNAITLQTAQTVVDGFVTISLSKNETTSVDNPKISGIEIKRLAPHTAHSVSGGPYHAVDVMNKGYVLVPVDGGESHTHGQNLVLNQWIWKEGAKVLGTGRTANLNLTVGEHSVVLTVVDSGGNDSAETFSVSVLPFGFPAVLSTSPSNGTINGNQLITITGSGFSFTANQTIVHFGLVNLTGSAIQIRNSTTITVMSPRVAIATPVMLSVTTPKGRSAAVSFTYVAASPIAFDSAKLMDLASATVARFGPDEKLYVGTLYGQLAKITLNSNFTAVVSTTVATVCNFKAILGIAFDPMDAGNPIPPIYVSSSYFFHGESNNTFGEAINGKILRVTGANLDVVENVVTGLPVSDADHGINGIEFGNQGELYIQIGSNTNGGIPGPLTGKQIQMENYYSAATLVAKMADPLFNGFITYDAVNDGAPNGGFGIKVFAAGTRNPFGIVMHSNGMLYGTDNGSNLPYGNMMVGCGEGQFVTAVETEDKVNLLQEGNYYGHPNAKRAIVDNDPRQCTWRSPTSSSSVDFTAPLLIARSSMDGIIEYQADHFDSQLRGNLIASKYTDGLFRIILTADGLGVIPQSVPALPLIGDWGLDVCQAPNGNLVEVRLSTNSLFYHRPIEATTTKLKVLSVFPHRGPNTGGTKLNIYGVNLSGTGLAVKVGGRNCPIVTRTTTKLTCTIPGGTNGNVDVVVTSSTGSYAFQKGYRYISGF